MRLRSAGASSAARTASALSVMYEIELTAFSGRLSANLRSFRTAAWTTRASESYIDVYNGPIWAGNRRTTTSSWCGARPPEVGAWPQGYAGRP
jgi:hypothetical protein